MIETEKQRRWWFATHPEYSEGAGGDKPHKSKVQEHNQPKVPPEEVDAAVDRALLTATGVEAALLKSIKRNFGTEGFPEETAVDASDHPAADRDSYDQYEDVLDALEAQRQEYIEWHRRTYAKGLIPDPVTALDFIPLGRFVTSPVKALRALLWSMGRRSVLSTVKGMGSPGGPRLPLRGTKDRAKIAGRAAGVSRPSRILGRNLEKAGRPRPPDHATHHIVPFKEPRFPEADKAREILKRFNVDLNDAANGVWLPNKPSIGQGTYHGATYGQPYYEQVLDRLRDAESREDVIRILERIGRDLSNDTLF